MKKKLFQYVLPAALVAGFLCFFFNDALHYIPNKDDDFNDEYVSKLGIIEAAKLFFSNINGRWFSHIITAIVFAFLKHNYFYYAVYVTGIMFLFVASISVLYKNYLRTFLQKETTLLSSLLFALVFTATLYFLLFVGRQEVWAWVSSANNHLLSVILSVFLFSLLIRENNTILKTISVCILAAAIGGLNEVNAVCCAMTAVGLFAVQRFYYHQLKLSKLTIWLAVFIIISSLAVNAISGGYESRMNSLPNFTIPQSIKNTVHTFALPIMQYRYIALRVCTLLIFLFFIDVNFTALKPNKGDIMIAAGLFVIISASFFLHCYILSDIVPSRGEVWGYTLMLFMLFAFVKKKKNI
jgi:hypothetical protein